MQWTLRVLVLVFLLLRIWSSSFSHRSLSQVWVPPCVFVHLPGCHGGIWHASNLFRMKFLLRKRSLLRLRLVRIASALVWAASLLVQVDVIFLEEALIAKKNGHSDSDEKLTILSALYLRPSDGLGPQQVDLRFALQILFLESARWRFILSDDSQPASGLGDSVGRGHAFATHTRPLEADQETTAVHQISIMLQVVFRTPQCVGRGRTIWAESEHHSPLLWCFILCFACRKTHPSPTWLCPCKGCMWVRLFARILLLCAADVQSVDFCLDWHYARQ